MTFIVFNENMLDNKGLSSHLHYGNDGNQPLVNVGNDDVEDIQEHDYLVIQHIINKNNKSHL